MSNQNSQKNLDAQTRGYLDTSRSNLGGQYQGAITGFQGDRDRANYNSSTLRNSLLQTYGRPATSTYGNPPPDARTNSGGGLPSFTGSDASTQDIGPVDANGAPAYSTSNDGSLNSFMPSGMSPNSQGWFNLPADGGPQYAAGGDFSQAKSGYSNFANTGGADQYAKAQAGADEFARTGGVDATALRQRATAIIPSFYKAYKDASQRRANVQGGYSPGFDAQQAELARNAGQEGFNASRQVEGDIADKTQAGREFGINAQTGIAGNINSNKLTGLGGLTNIGGLEQSNNQFNAGVGNSYSARNLAAQLQLADMYQKGQQFSASGLSNLYGQDRSDAQAANSNLLASLGGLSNEELQNLQLRLAASQSGKGIDWSKWFGSAGSMLGLLSGFGGGSDPNKNNTNLPPPATTINSGSSSPNIR